MKRLVLAVALAVVVIVAGVGLWQREPATRKPVAAGRAAPPTAAERRTPDAPVTVANPRAAGGGVEVARRAVVPLEERRGPERRGGAQVEVAGRTVTLVPDDQGLYERLAVRPRQTLPVVITFPKGEVGEYVGVTVQDGGRLMEDGRVAGVRRLDERRQIRFTVQLTGNLGLFRVTVRRGGEVQELSFWADGEPVRPGMRGEG